MILLSIVIVLALVLWACMGPRDNVGATIKDVVLRTTGVCLCLCGVLLAVAAIYILVESGFNWTSTGLWLGATACNVTGAKLLEKSFYGRGRTCGRSAD